MSVRPKESVVFYWYSAKTLVQEKHGKRKEPGLEGWCTLLGTGDAWGKSCSNLFSSITPPQ